ncbi:hypothetical protein [Xanthomonas oryzae]|uniref:hypothetical protein n=1 Tax=Xanthomonas oryzae TaxID=347 RepID=UPI000CBA9327|nr:hypothetical protein [Xanthomonas oryzae]PNR77389.1 hypothetical protein LA21_02520 [Xanthomonas oryzae pv. oryzae]
MVVVVVLDAITRLLTDNAAIDVCDRFLGESTTLYTSLYYERGSATHLLSTSHASHMAAARHQAAAVMMMMMAAAHGISPS